jgi:hypothetical protein
MRPSAVHPTVSAMNVQGQRFAYTFPQASVTVIEILGRQR